MIFNSKLFLQFFLDFCAKISLSTMRSGTHYTAVRVKFGTRKVLVFQISKLKIAEVVILQKPHVGLLFQLHVCLFNRITC